MRNVYEREAWKSLKSQIIGDGKTDVKGNINISNSHSLTDQQVTVVWLKIKYIFD